MYIEIEKNPNSPAKELMVFQTFGDARHVAQLAMKRKGANLLCDVTGVDTGGVWVPAEGIKIADSGDGFAYLVKGGAWGIRLRPQSSTDKSWDLNDPDQWGEPYLIYGLDEEIVWH